MNGPGRAVSQEQVVRALLARWAWVVVGALIGVVAFGAYGVATKSTYTAEASVVVRPISQNPFDTSNNTPDKTLTMPNEVILGRSQAVLDRASAALNHAILTNELRKNSSVSNPSNTTVLQFDYKSKSKATASNVANVIANAYLVQRQSQAQQVLSEQSKSLQLSLNALNGQATGLARSLGQLSATSPERDALTAQLAQVTGSLRDVQQQIATLNSIDTTPGQLVQPATSPKHRDGPSMTLLLLAGGILGAILGFLAAVIRVRFNNRIRHAYELAPVDRAGLVMEIPRGSGQGAAEVWRLLAVRLHNRGVGDIYRNITVTSPRGEADRNAVTRLVQALREVGLPTEATVAWPTEQAPTAIRVAANPMSDGASALNAVSRADAAVVLISRGTHWQRLNNLFDLLEEAKVPVMATGIVRSRIPGRSGSVPPISRGSVQQQRTTSAGAKPAPSDAEARMSTRLFRRSNPPVPGAGGL